MAVFNIGVSNAYAEDAKTTEINNVETYILQCNSQATIAYVSILNLNFQESFSSFSFLLDPECEPRTIERDDGSIVIISSDCRYAIIPAPEEE